MYTLLHLAYPFYSSKVQVVPALPECIHTPPLYNWSLLLLYPATLLLVPIPPVFMQAPQYLQNPAKHILVIFIPCTSRIPLGSSAPPVSRGVFHSLIGPCTSLPVTPPGLLGLSSSQTWGAHVAPQLPITTRGSPSSLQDTPLDLSTAVEWRPAGAVWSRVVPHQLLPAL